MRGWLPASGMRGWLPLACAALLGAHARFTSATRVGAHARLASTLLGAHARFTSATRVGAHARLASTAGLAAPHAWLTGTRVRRAAHTRLPASLLRRRRPTATTSTTPRGCGRSRRRLRRSAALLGLLDIGLRLGVGHRRGAVADAGHRRIHGRLGRRRVRCGVDRLEQRVGLERLHDHLVRAGSERFILAEVSVSTAQHHDRDPGGAAVVFQRTAHLEPASVGHVIVEKDHRRRLLGSFHRLLRASDTDDLERSGFERHLDDFADGSTVIGDQNRRTHAYSLKKIDRAAPLHSQWDAATPFRA